MAEQPERRVSERLAVGAETTCTFVSPVVMGFGGARIKNISMEGIGLLLSRRVDPGTTLAVTLANASKGYAKTTLVRVVHATPQQDGWLIGGTFQVPLTYQELTTLVMQVPTAGEPWKIRT